VKAVGGAAAIQRAAAVAEQHGALQVLADDQRLQLPHEGVHRILPGRQRSRAAIAGPHRRIDPEPKRAQLRLQPLQRCDPVQHPMHKDHRLAGL